MLRRFTIATATLMGTAILCAPAFADTVNLGGSVADTTALTTTATAGATTLNLYGEGTANADTVVKVADLDVTSNSGNGVTLSASADSSLSNGTDSLAYNVRIVADGTTPSAGDFTGTSHSDNSVTMSSGAAARDLFIEYDAPQLLDSGAYTSTITVTVSDN